MSKKDPVIGTRREVLQSSGVISSAWSGVGDRSQGLYKDFIGDDVQL